MCSDGVAAPDSVLRWGRGARQVPPEHFQKAKPYNDFRVKYERVLSNSDLILIHHMLSGSETLILLTTYITTTLNLTHKHYKYINT